MSHHSGFSSASRMEIERLNQVSAATAAVSAAEMAAKDKKLAALEALLVANGLAPAPTPSHIPTSSGTGCGSRGGHGGRGGRGGLKRFNTSPTESSSAKKNNDKVSPGINRRFWDVASDPMQIDNDDITEIITLPQNQGLAPEADLPIPSKRWTEPKCSLNNDGPIRQTFEIEIRTLNGRPYRGSMCPKEAKHGIYKGCLDLELSNFYGARPGWNNCPTITFTLCNPINVDDMSGLKYFDYIRKRKVGNRVVDETLGCHIKGLRSKPEAGASWVPFKEDWTRLVKLEGCEYSISVDQMKAWLSNFGDILSPIVEDCFEDSESNEGINALGTYSVKMKLNKEIPQLLPMCGKRVKIYYRGIEKMCFNCFGKHQRKTCNNEKVPWMDYVKLFMTKNPDFPPQAFGKWAALSSETKDVNEVSNKSISKMSKVLPHMEASALNLSSKPSKNSLGEGTSKQHSFPTKPSSSTEAVNQENLQLQSFLTDLSDELPKEPWPSEFGVPQDEEETDRMVENMAANGIKASEAELIILSRKKEYESALKKFNTKQKKRKTKNIPSKAKNQT